MRWSEEVLLVREEMRRVLQFLEWHARWWEGRQTQHDGSSPELAEGVLAYACKQASIRRSIRTSFKQLWHRSDEFKTLGIGANDEILDLQQAAAYELLDTSLL